FVYDDLGRVIETIADAADGGLQIRTSSTYDHAGRQLSSTDALRQTTQYGYDDATGQLTTVTLPRVNDGSNGSDVGQAVYEYGYDDYGNQTLIRDPMDVKFIEGGENKETLFEFDHLGRQTKRTLPDGLTETMEYDDLGRVIQSVDFEGRTVDYVYDDLGRLDEKHYFDVGTAPNALQQDPGESTNYDEVVDYVYDGLGRTTKVTQDLDPDITGEERITNNTYDEEGRLDRVTTPEGIVNYEYDNLGRKTRTYAGASLGTATTQTDYSYDALGRLAS
ncbi:unnamed protein product, partial [Ectocarpus sp. 4 AP-2014]